MKTVIEILVGCLKRYESFLRDVWIDVDSCIIFSTKEVKKFCGKVNFGMGDEALNCGWNCLNR